VFDFEGASLVTDADSMLTFRDAGIRGGTLDIGEVDRLTLQGSVSLIDGARILLPTAGEVRTRDNTVITGGDIVLRGATVGSFDNSGLVVGEGAALVGPGTIETETTLRSGAAIRVDEGMLATRVLTVDAGATVSVQNSGTGLSSQMLNNMGEITVDGGSLGASRLNNFGSTSLRGAESVSGVTIENDGLVRIEDGARLTTLLTNRERVEVASGAKMTVNNLVNSGILEVRSNGVLESFGAIANTGMIDIADSTALFSRPLNNLDWGDTGAINISDSDFRLGSGVYTPDDLRRFTVSNSTLTVLGVLASDGGQGLDLAPFVGDIHIRGGIDASASVLDFAGRTVSLGGGNTFVTGSIANAQLITTTNGSLFSVDDLSLIATDWLIDARDARLRAVFGSAEHTLAAGVVRFGQNANGTIEFESIGSEAEIAGADVLVRVSSSFENFGVLRATPTSAERADASFRMNGDPDSVFRNAGEVIADGGRFTIENEQMPGGVRLFNLANSTLTGGEWAVRNGGELDLAGRTFFTNEAVIAIEGQTSRFEAARSIVFNRGALSIVDHTFESSSPLLFNAGEGELTLDRATVRAATVRNAADLRVTRSTIDAQSFVLDPTSSLFIDIGDTINDGLTITGDATIAGSLEILTHASLDIVWGDRFEVIRVLGSRVGDFESVATPTEPGGLAWEFGWDEGVFVLRARDRADLNDNGVIDAEDLAIVLDHYGMSNGIADIDGDGIVAFGDLNIVLSRFGDAAPRAMPTPGAATALLLASVGIACRRRRSSTRGR
jgi:hypothetical protein